MVAKNWRLRRSSRRSGLLEDVTRTPPAAARGRHEMALYPGPVHPLESMWSNCEDPRIVQQFTAWTIAIAIASSHVRFVVVAILVAVGSTGTPHVQAGNTT